MWFSANIYRPPTKYWEANVFNRACLFTRAGWVSIWPFPMLHWTPKHVRLAARLECFVVYFSCECYYRPQRSCGQGNIFTPVCHSVHRGPGVSEAEPPPPKVRPPGRRYPRQHTPPGSRPIPGSRPPGSRHHPQQTSPRTRPAPPEADSSIRSTSGRYASYWNAFLC